MCVIAFGCYGGEEMASVVKKLAEAGVIAPPVWLAENIMYETMTGSVAYGCAEADASDVDVMGYAVPKKHMVFPHLDGHIPGFGKPAPSFDQYQKHHIHFPETRKNYDVTVYGLVKFFNLCMDNNPNMISGLFAPRRCILHSTSLSEHVRDHRRLFLHQGCFARFRGYAYAQLKKLDSNRSAANPARQDSIEAHGFDTKFAYHIVRLACECEQILRGGDLVLDRDRELYKGIRRGEWSKARIRGWFAEKERELEDLKAKTKLPERPDEDRLKSLLLETLEMHYGSLSQAVSSRGKEEKLIERMVDAIYKYDPQALYRHERDSGRGENSQDASVDNVAR